MSTLNTVQVPNMVATPVVDDQIWNTWLAKNREADKRTTAKFFKAVISVVIALAIAGYVAFNGKLW